MDPGYRSPGDLVLKQLVNYFRDMEEMLDFVDVVRESSLPRMFVRGRFFHEKLV